MFYVALYDKAQKLLFRYTAESRVVPGNPTLFQIPSTTCYVSVSALYYRPILLICHVYEG